MLATTWMNNLRKSQDPHYLRYNRHDEDGGDVDALLPGGKIPWVSSIVLAVPVDYVSGHCGITCEVPYAVDGLLNACTGWKTKSKIEQSNVCLVNCVYTREQSIFREGRPTCARLHRRDGVKEAALWRLGEW